MLRYKHLITTTCDRNWRWYGTIDNPYQYPSASTIQKATIPPDPSVVDWWMDNNRSKCEQVLKKAGEYGTQCHTLFERCIKHEEFDVPEGYLKPVDQFKQWLFKHKVKHMASEFTVVSTRYGYAGRVDELAEVDGNIELLDWKTGNHYSDSWASQCGGYHLALTEMLGMKAEDLGIRVVHIPRDGSPLKEFKFQHIDFIQDSFLLCVERFKRAPHYNYLKKMGWNYVTESIFARRSV